MRKKVIIDTDPGVDDALAIILALKSSELEVVAITTVYGNVPVSQATINIRKILNLFEDRKLLGIIKWPAKLIISEGAEAPLFELPMHAFNVHGQDGLGNISHLKEKGVEKYPPKDIKIAKEKAWDTIASLVKEDPGNITIITLGPLTNIAKAIDLYSEEMGGVKEIIMMGGAIYPPGNVSPVAEFNIYLDPHAAQKVITSGIPIKMVGLDVTQKVVLKREKIEELRRRTDKISQFISDIIGVYLDYHLNTEEIDGVYIHDPLAVAVSIDESLVKIKNFKVDIEVEGGICRGMTVADLRRKGSREGPKIAVCMDVDAERFIDFFIKRITA